MLKMLNSKLFKFAKFAANSQGIKTGVAEVVVHRNGTSDIYGRFHKHR